jgi:hypothetical protein
MLIASNVMAQVYLLKNLKKGTLGISRGGDIDAKRPH